MAKTLNRISVPTLVRLFRDEPDPEVREMCVHELFVHFRRDMAVIAYKLGKVLDGTDPVVATVALMLTEAGGVGSIKTRHKLNAEDRFSLDLGLNEFRRQARMSMDQAIEAVKAGDVPTFGEADEFMRRAAEEHDKERKDGG